MLIFSAFITFLLFIVTLVPFTKWYLKRAKFSKIIDAIPGPKWYPLIGTAHVFLGVPRRNLYNHIRNVKAQYPGIMRSWFGPLGQVDLSRAEYVEKILSSSKSHLQKAWTYKFVHSWLGEGLLTSAGEKWFSHRKIITPTFHFSILENFCEIFAEKSNILVQKLEAHSGTGKSFDVYPYITKAALDIIADAAMGTQVNAQEEKENEYVKAVYEVAELIVRRMMRPWLYLDSIYKYSKDGREMNRNLTVLHSFTNKIITERKANWKNGGEEIVNQNDDIMGKKKRLAFLDLLLETSEKGPVRLSDADLREEVDTFMFEGHDTTTAGIAWALFLLALHPDIQQQCYDELELIFQGSDRPATVKDFGEMKVLDRVIKETLRLYPSVPIIGRMLSEDVQIDEYTIPAGCTVVIEIFSLHMNEKHFPDPERFDPDRFLPEISVGRHPYAYIPFSAGSRNCIGQKFAVYEEKSILSSIIRKYRFTTNVTRETTDRVLELITRPIDGIPLILEKRI